MDYLILMYIKYIRIAVLNDNKKIHQNTRTKLPGLGNIRFNTKENHFDAILTRDSIESTRQYGEKFSTTNHPLESRKMALVFFQTRLMKVHTINR